MAKQEGSNIKLGVFVLTGLVVMMVSFYLIGNNTSMFKSSFILKARFSNLDGLVEGNNVLFSGIQAGTVKTISIINDTTIEIIMLIDSKVQSYIHKNAEASIGTEGLMGNKVVNIQPVKNTSPLVEKGDRLVAQRLANMNDMLKTLSKTNNNIATISEALKTTVLKLDTSAIFKMFSDERIATSLNSSLQNIQVASKSTSDLTQGLNEMVIQLKHGKGTAGMLLTDTAMAGSFKTTMYKIRSASENMNKMTLQLNKMATQVDHELMNGKGPIHVLLRDSNMTRNLNRSVENIEKATVGANQVVEALKHNFLVRGFFKSQDKKKKDSLLKLDQSKL